MVSKDIVKRTIQILEDYLDVASELDIEAQRSITELLNFWRLYYNFTTEEEA